MRPYEKEELEERGKIDTLLSGKPEGNAWKEITNVLADAVCVTDLEPGALKKIASKWGVSFNDRNNDKRINIYSKLTERVYANVWVMNDPWFTQCDYLAEQLNLSPQLQQLAKRKAKNKAYGERCRNIINGTEKMNINELNKFFDYDYDDGLAARKEAFEEFFYKKFEKFEETQRYSKDDEAELVEVTKKLDIPFELKENLMTALVRFRNLWNAESQDLQPIEVSFDLMENEACYAGTNAGRCVMKKIQEYYIIIMTIFLTVIVSLM